MRKLLLAALITTAVWAQPTVSNIETVLVTNSSVTLKFETSSVGAHVRVRYGPTTSYEGSGSFPAAGIQDFDGYDTNPTKYIQIRVGALSANTLYHFCPQVSVDGSTWSTCVDHTETTAATPGGEYPVKPIAPTAVPTARPDTSGYTTRATNCAGLQGEINAAAANLFTAGSLITVPAGSVCSPITLTAPPTKSWTATNVNTATGTINLTSHGFSEGDLVTVAGDTPGSAGPDDCDRYRGLVSGSRYYVKYVDANSFQLSLTNGGAAVPFTFSTITADPDTDYITVTSQRVVPHNGTEVQFVGSDLPAPLAQNTAYTVTDGFASLGQACGEPAGGNHDLMRFKLSGVDITDAGSGTNYIASRGGSVTIGKVPTNWIIIRTATPDAEFVPEGVRVTPEFQPKMATIRTTTPLSIAHAVSYSTLASHYRVEGLEITHSDVATAQISSTVNPDHFYGLIYTDMTTSNILFDRCYIHGLPWPNRMKAPIELNGRNSGVIDSYLDHFQYWNPFRDTSLTRLSNTQFTIAAGAVRGAPEGSGSPLVNTIASTITVTLTGGGVSGSGRVYFDMSGGLVVHTPTGSSASCSPVSCTSTTSASPTWPVDGNGRATVLGIGTLTFSGGNLTAVANEDLYGTPWTSHVGESSSFHGVVQGHVFRNNYISGTGILWHISDNEGGLGATNTDVEIRRNTFDTPPTYSWYQPGSLKLRWFQRQQLEFKSCARCKVTGNRFQHTFLDNSPNAAGFLLSGVPGPNTAMRDIEFGYNVLGPGSGTLAIGGGRPLSNNQWLRPPNEITRRIWVHDNVGYLTDANAQAGAWKSGLPAGSGYTHSGINLDIRGTLESVLVEHNTWYDTRGTAPAALFVGGTKGELFFRSNIFWVNHGVFVIKDECGDHTPACGAGDGKSVFDNMYGRYEFSRNSAIAGWTDASGMVARTSKTYLALAWPSMIDAYLQSETPGEIGWRSPATGDFRLGHAATHQSSGVKHGADGRDRGADMNRLERETGTIRLADVLIGSTAVTMRFLAPDRGTACYVLFGEGNDPATWTGRSSANTSNSYRRSITVSVAYGVDYRFRVGCAGAAMSSTRPFRL